MISLIVAIDPNGLIGNNDRLPGNISTELAFFRKQTMGKFLLMGKTTYLSLPQQLPGRKIIVLSKTAHNLGVKTIRDFSYIKKNFGSSAKEIFIAGGKLIYEQFYHEASTIYVSLLKKKYKGNIFLEGDLSQYKKTVYQDFTDFTVYKYTK